MIEQLHRKTKLQILYKPFDHYPYRKNIIGPYNDSSLLNFESGYVIFFCLNLIVFHIFLKFKNFTTFEYVVFKRKKQIREVQPSKFDEKENSNNSEIFDTSINKSSLSS